MSAGSRSHRTGEDRVKGVKKIEGGNEMRKKMGI
jgi:hypothetical protein